MKFLQSGDSVVSLHFKFQEMPQGYEDTEVVTDKLTFDTVGEIQDALANLFPNRNAPFTLQEDILDLDAFRAQGGYTQADVVNQLSRFVNNLNALLDNNGDPKAVQDFTDALQEFIGNRAVDLSEFRNEAGELMQEVAATSEKVNTLAGSRLEMAELSAAVTAEGLKRDARLNETGERVPDQPIMRVASTVAKLPETLDQVIASLDKETALFLGETAFRSFDADSAAA